MADVIEIGAIKSAEDRLAEFNSELQALCVRMSFNIGAEPYVLDGEIKCRVVVADAKGVEAEKLGGEGAI